MGTLLAVLLIGTSILTGCGSKPASGTEAQKETAAAVKESEGKDVSEAPVTEEKATFDDDITMYVHVKVGGALDVRARVVAEYLSKELGTNVTVENIAGAGGVTCVSQMLAQPHSEYDLLFAGVSVFTSCPLFTQTTYSLNDFRPLAPVDAEHFGLFVCKDQTGMETFDDVVSYAADHEVIYGSGGTGNVTQLYQASLYKKLGMNASTLAHDGAVQGITNLMGGHNVITMAGLETARTYVESGDIIPVLTFDSEPYEGYEGYLVPSVLDVGGSEDNTYQGMMFVSCLAGVDDAHALAMETALRKVLADPACIEDLKKVGLSEVPDLTSDELVDYINTEITVIENIIETIK